MTAETTPEPISYERPSWDDYFYEIAAAVADRASCPRAHMGCVIVDPESHRILATGYNGAPPGWRDCYQDGCLMTEDGLHCIRTIHAELNAVLSAARNGVSVNGAVAYLRGPRAVCSECAKMLTGAGIVLVKARL